MELKSMGYCIPARTLSQIRDIVTAAEAAIQELLSHCILDEKILGSKEHDFHQKYYQVKYGHEGELEDIF